MSYMYFFANFLFMLVAFTKIELEILLFHNVEIDKGDKNLTSRCKPAMAL